jgi:hypothetical protein
MKKVIMVLMLVFFVLLIIANIMYVGKQHIKVLNDSHVLEEEVNTLKEHNETIMELVHEGFIPKEKFTKVIDSLSVEIIHRDLTIKEVKETVSVLKKKNTPLPPKIIIPPMGIYHYHDSVDIDALNKTLKLDTLLSNE